MRAVILHGIMAVPASAHHQPFGSVPNHFQQHPVNGRGGHMMGNGSGRGGGGGGRLIVGGAVVSQWENNRGGSAQQRLVRARKDKKPQSAKSQAKRQNQKVSFSCLFFH